MESQLDKVDKSAEINKIIVNSVERNQLCKICKMMAEAPELFLELHHAIYVYALPRVKAMHVINDKISTKQLNIQLINSANLAAHFNKHMKTDIERKLEPYIDRTQMIPKEVIKNQPIVYPVEFGARTSSAIDRRIGSELQDYANLQDLIGMIYEKLMKVDGYIEITNKTKDEDGEEQTALSIEALAAFTKLVTELRNCISEINKIRKGNNIVLSTIKLLAKNFCEYSMRRLTQEFTKIEDELRKAGVHDSIIMIISEQYRQTIANVLVDTSQIAVEEAMKDYRIKEG